MYENDQPKSLNSAKINTYADDTAITVQGNDHILLNSLMNEQLAIAGNWINANNLSLNVVKRGYFGLSTYGRKVQKYKS